MKWIVLSTLIIGLSFIGNAAEARSLKIAKVAISKTGRISYNGNPTTIEGLKPKLKALQQSETTVLYYREESAGDPPKQASEALGLIMSYRLHMVMSSKADYSDVSDIGELSQLE